MMNHSSCTLTTRQIDYVVQFLNELIKLIEPTRVFIESRQAEVLRSLC
jgi:hypothetical protein